MEVRNLVISYDEHKCRIGGQKGTLKAINIVETLPNGKKKTACNSAGGIFIFSSLYQGDIQPILKYHI